MKTLKLFTIITLAVLGLSLTVAAQEDENELQAGLAMVVGRNLTTLRADANNGSERLGQIATGSLLTVIQINDDGWVNVEYDGQEGWLRNPQLINVSGPVPQPRGFAGMAYDTESNRVILAGGWYAGGPRYTLAETWAYDPEANTWENMGSDNTPGRGQFTMMYHADSDRVIALLNEPIDLPLGQAGETWAYDYNTNTWTNLEPEESPSPRNGVMAAYDSESDRFILFGGLNPRQLTIEGLYDETWAYDPVANTWTNMEPEIHPDAWNFNGMDYDPVTDRVILFGTGDLEDFSSVGNETWTYDFNTNTWEQLDPEGAPRPIESMQMVYTSATGQMIFYGGFDPAGGVIDETWAYDPVEQVWIQLTPPTTPGPLSIYSFVSLGDQIMLFGGGPGLDDLNNETWIYDPAEVTWTQVGP